MIMPGLRPSTANRFKNIAGLPVEPLATAAAGPPVLVGVKENPEHSKREKNHDTNDESKHFRIFAWILVVYNLAVILWGALVRATGSGAGCGSHWPLCNGEVIPLAPSVETRIEFTHRLMSGVDGLLVLLLVVWAMRAFGKGHPVRFGAALSLACSSSANRWLARIGQIRMGSPQRFDRTGDRDGGAPGQHLLSAGRAFAHSLVGLRADRKVRLDGQGSALLGVGPGHAGRTADRCDGRNHCSG
jgi:hypothetical protein